MSSTNELISLPFEILVELLSHLDLKSLSQICQTSSVINNVCNSTTLWRIKYLDEFKQTLHFNQENTFKSSYAQKKKLVLYQELVSTINDQLKLVSHHELDNYYAENIVRTSLKHGIDTSTYNMAIHNAIYNIISQNSSLHHSILDLHNILLSNYEKIKPNIDNLLKNYVSQILYLDKIN